MSRVTRILVAEPFAREAVDCLREMPMAEVVHEPSLAREGLLRMIPGFDVIVVRSRTQVDVDLIRAATSLKMIALAATAHANVDLGAAERRGIRVVHCAGMTANAVAEITLGLMLSLARHIVTAHQNLQRGGWDRERFLGHELRGRKLGVVGCGATGGRVIELALAFGMKVHAYDHRPSPEKTWRFVSYHQSLAELAANSEILSLHIPLCKETEGIINQEILSRLPRGAMLINTARGELVCEEALLRFLQEEHLSGAAIDTWCHEPHPRRELVTHPRVIGLPHIGGSTVEAQVAMLLRVRDALEEKHHAVSR